MKIRTLPIHTIFLLIGLASMAYADEQEEHVFKVSGPVSLSVSTTSGDITVKAGGRAEVRVVSYKSSRNDETSFEQFGDRIRIETRRGRIRYQITAPAHASADLHSVSGNIDASGLNGKIEAITTSGWLRLEAIKERILAKTVSGNLTVRRCQSDFITVGSVSGDVTLDEVGGKIEAKSVSGNVRLTRARCAGLDITTTSGDITYNGTIAQEGNYTLHSHSGSIRMALPLESSFEVVAGTFSGDIESDFPLQLVQGGKQKRMGRNALRAIYKDGKSQLELKTFSGDIKLTKQ